jgi:RNA polymerase sigma-70 factor (ECF subfamily)
MYSTSTSLLDRLKVAAPDSPDWRHLHELYQPLIHSLLIRVAGKGDHCEDLAQEILLVIVRELPQFERQRSGSFRAWIRQIAVHRCQAFFKSQKRQPIAPGGNRQSHLLAQLEDHNSELSQSWDQEPDRHVVQQLLKVVKGDFEPTTWEAFKRFALQGKPAAQVAAALGITENAVVLAKSRILKRLREEAGVLLD